MIKKTTELLPMWDMPPDLAPLLALLMTDPQVYQLVFCPEDLYSHKTPVLVNKRLTICHPPMLEPIRLACHRLLQQFANQGDVPVHSASSNYPYELKLCRDGTGYLHIMAAGKLDPIHFRWRETPP